MPVKKKTRCGRCGDVKLLTKEGPYKAMLCEDCAETKKHEEEVERAMSTGDVL